LHENFRKGWQWASEQILNFDPDHCLDTWIVFWIRDCWDMQKVVNGHKSGAHTDSPDGGTGMMCLGGGVHYPSASSSCIIVCIMITIDA